MSIVASRSPSGLRRVPILHIADLRPRQFPRTFVSFSMGCEGFPKASDDKKETKPKVPSLGVSSCPSDLRFDRLQPSDEDCDCKHRRVFGGFVAREALLDEELWTAAWLRAESEWEDKSDVRHVDSFKRKFAEQEFHGLKRRSTGQQLMEKCTCIIVVKKEEMNVKRTVLSSIVGTLDISLRHLISGETFPGEHLKVPAVCNIFGRRDQPVYGYVSNLCVPKYARRQGIASNMLRLAVEAAETYGANEIYVQVHKDNLAAQKLYEKIGFEIVEAAIPQYLEEKTHLLCLKIQSSSSQSSS